MSVFEVGKTISESTGGHASAGGNSGAGNRFFFSDDAYCELGLQRGTAYNVRIRLKGSRVKDPGGDERNTSAYIKLTMIGHRGYAPHAIGNHPFCYIVEALPQPMGYRSTLTPIVQGITTRSFEEGIEAQHLMGIETGQLYPTVSCFQYTDYTEITLRVMNQSNIANSRDNRSAVQDSTPAPNSAALTKHYAGQEDNTVAGQSGELGGDAIFFTAYIDGYSYNSTLSEGIFTSYNRILGGRGVFAAGYTTAVQDTIDYVAIPVKGNASDFGNLVSARESVNDVTNGSRGVIGGGSPPALNIMEHITIGSPANSLDFGDLTLARYGLSATSDGSRGIFGGGYATNHTDTIDYITIGIIGNSLDFGELVQGARNGLCATSDGSRGIFGAGHPSAVDHIEYITMSTLSNSSDFGERTESKRLLAAISDGSRGVFGGGHPASNVMDYINIQTLSDARDFGDLSQSRAQVGGAGDGSRGLFAGGTPSLNTMDFITMTSIGNATDYGDLSQGRNLPGIGISGD